MHRSISARLAMNVFFFGALVVPLVGRGQEVHYDVFVTSDGTNLVLGGYDDAATTAIIPSNQMRVFGGEVVPSGASPAPYESASPGEPGFRAGTQAFLNNASLTTPASVYTALPGSTPLTFSFLPLTIGAATRNLFFWGGSGTVAFAPTANDVAVTLTKQGGGGWSAGITGTSAGIVAGNTIQTTSSGASVGTIHTHLFASIDKGGLIPDKGFYLFSLQLAMTGLQSSESAYFVFGALDPDAMTPQQLVDFETAHGLAEAWVETNLAAVPEPATGLVALLAASGMGVFITRRHRRNAGFAPSADPAG